MTQFSAALLRAALRARTTAAAFYLDDPRVTLIDVGLRVKDQEGGAITDELSVRVHVSHKPRGLAFEAFAARHPDRIIDPDRVGFPIDVIESTYTLHQQLGGWGQPRPPRARTFDPLCGGISISNAWDAKYGTLGGFVRDRQSGEAMILSAWHVLVGSAYVPQGIKIYQPGGGDGGLRQNTVAHLSRHGMRDGIDAAVAALEGDRAFGAEQLGLGPITGLIEPTLGMAVTKSGRTTEITSGVIDGIDGVLSLRYGGFPRTVRYIVHIAPSPAGGPVSAPGDSGALWLDAATHRAVGLHFAGSDDPEYGLAVAMPQVLDALDIELITTT